MPIDPDEHLGKLTRFFSPRFSSRYVALLESSRRERLRRYLSHFEDHLDNRFAQRIPDGQQRHHEIGAMLRAHGAPAECYLLAEDRDLDGRQMFLAEALELIVGNEPGTIVSCLPGRLAYYEGEELGHRYILERPTN